MKAGPQFAAWRSGRRPRRRQHPHRTPSRKSAHQRQTSDKLTIHRGPAPAGPFPSTEKPRPVQPPSQDTPGRIHLYDGPCGLPGPQAGRRATSGETAVGCAVRPCSRHTSFPVSPGRKPAEEGHHRPEPDPWDAPFPGSRPRRRYAAAERPGRAPAAGPLTGRPRPGSPLPAPIPAILRGAAPTSVLAVFVSGFHSISPCEDSYARQRRSRTASPSARVSGLASLSGLR